MASIRKRGNSYQIRVSNGFTHNGERIIKYTTWTPPKNMTSRQIEKELNKVAVEFENEVQNGQCIDSKLRFADYAELWMKRGEENGEHPLAVRTHKRYAELLVRINQSIGNIRLVDLQPHHIREFLKNIKETGIRVDQTYTAHDSLINLLKKKNLTRQKIADMTGLGIQTVYCAFRQKNVSKSTALSICHALNTELITAFQPQTREGNCLSDKTILHHFRLISAILNSAVKDDQALLSNPCDRVRPPHVDRDEAVFLDEKQAAELVSLLDKEPMQYRALFLLILYTGMRRGEVCGLEWKDIDFDNNVLSVVRESQYTPEKGIFVTPPKTEKSKRTIKVSESAIEILKAYKEWQKQQSLMSGDQWIWSDRLFTNIHGQPGHPDILTNHFSDFIKKTNLPQIHVHSLRHTNATLMIASGEDIMTIAKRLGHAQASTTTNIYGHAIQAADAKAAEALNNLLHPIK